jgi:UDP:flavonoid glycosyltransferase YjiC (YdhE family)
MARVLCAWEFGGDLGHVRRLIPIARELRTMGHDVSIAFRDSAFLFNSRSEGFETFIAPLLRAQRDMNPSPLNFSDVLLNLGFGDARGVAGALRAWHSMFEMIKPDVLVAEYAPTALIAGLLAGIRRVTVSAGFSVPLLSDPLPDLRPWQPTDPKVLRALDDRLLATVRQAAGSEANRIPSRASGLFHADAHLLCTFPEIDPFGPRPGVDYLGPPRDSTGGEDLRWTREAGPRVFAYLKARSRRFEAVIAALQSLDAEVIAAVPGLAADRAKSMSTPSMRVVPNAVNLDSVMPGASLVVCHAGAGVPARAMAAGVPMALLPLQLDQFLMAKNIEKTGAAVVSNPEEPAPDFREWLSAPLTQPRYGEAARRLRESHGSHDFDAAVKRTASRISQVAAG